MIYHKHSSNFSQDASIEVHTSTSILNGRRKVLRTKCNFHLHHNAIQPSLDCGRRGHVLTLNIHNDLNSMCYGCYWSHSTVVPQCGVSQPKNYLNPQCPPRVRGMIGGSSCSLEHMQNICTPPPLSHISHGKQIPNSSWINAELNPSLTSACLNLHIAKQGWRLRRREDTKTSKIYHCSLLQQNHGGVKAGLKVGPRLRDFPCNLRQRRKSITATAAQEQNFTNPGARLYSSPLYLAHNITYGC